MRTGRGRTAALRRLEGRLWTGRLAHLIGGGLDVSAALVRYALARVRGRPLR